MSSFTESSDNDTPALTYYVKAINAFEQGKPEYAEELCQIAAKLYERASNDEVSAVYIQLGLIEYWRRNFDAAEKWYRKALEIEERIGDEHSAARTYHYLSSVAKGRGDFESAEKWLWKSIHIREKQGDDIGASDCYHQLGLIAYGRGDLDAAEQ